MHCAACWWHIKGQIRGCSHCLQPALCTTVCDSVHNYEWHSIAATLCGLALQRLSTCNIYGSVGNPRVRTADCKCFTLKNEMTQAQQTSQCHQKSAMVTTTTLCSVLARTWFFILFVALSSENKGGLHLAASCRFFLDTAAVYPSFESTYGTTGRRQLPSVACVAVR